jgi:single-strand DNA-binding protein
MDLNRVMIIGRLTRDPELRSLPSGRSVASFSVATNRQWTDQGGQKQKQVEYHNIVAWARLAETASQYLKKGSQVYVEGHLQTRDWTAGDGTKKNRTEIICDNFIMLGSRPAGFEPGPAPTSSSQSSGPAEVIEEEIKVEDIPF